MMRRYSGTSRPKLVISFDELFRLGQASVDPLTVFEYDDLVLRISGSNGVSK